MNKSIQEKSFVILGSVLLLAYIGQYAFSIRWESLYQLQQLNESYKRWSGVFVATFILFQWALTIIRISKKLRSYNTRLTILHKWIGVLSPIFFYIHAMEFGYGYLAFLSYIFFINMLLGTINLDIIKSKKEWIFQAWMIIHVLLSVLITSITIFHIGVVFYYK